MRNPPRPGNEPMSPCKGRQIHFISIALPGKSNLFLLCDESLKQLSLSTCPFYILRPFSELWHKTVIFLFSTCLISYFSCWVFPADLRALTAFPSPKLNRHGISSTLCMVLDAGFNMSLAILTISYCLFLFMQMFTQPKPIEIWRGVSFEPDALIKQQENPPFLPRKSS